MREPPQRKPPADGPDPDAPEPPSPPDTERRIRLYPFQWVVVPLLVVIPLLAALTVLGPRYGVVSEERSGLSVSAEYPTITRFGRPELLSVVVRNGTGAAIEAGVLVIDAAYLASFREVTTEPGPMSAYRLELPPLQPGDSQVIRIHGRPHRYFRTGGFIEHHVGDAAPLLLRLSTFNLP